MYDLIDKLEEHTNNDSTEQVMQTSFVSLVIGGIIFCISLLI